MPFKSKTEKERLEMNAKAQAILMRSFSSKSVEAEVKAQNTRNKNDIYEPEGEIDYSKFNKAKK